MESFAYEDAYKAQKTFWWFVGRRFFLKNIFDRFLDKEKKLLLLDAGCGTGGTLEFINQFGFSIGMDVSSQALHFCKKNHLNNLLQGDINHLPIKHERFDCVIALDLLEHLENETVCLREFHRVLKPGGYLITFVPAYQFMWSYMDEIGHHFRRYSRKNLCKVLSETGYNIKWLTSFNLFLFPLIYLTRKLKAIMGGNKTDRIISDVRPIPKPLNNLFTGLLFLEGTISKFFTLHVGLSIICVSQK